MRCESLLGFVFMLGCAFILLWIIGVCLGVEVSCCLCCLIIWVAWLWLLLWTCLFAGYDWILYCGYDVGFCGGDFVEIDLLRLRMLVRLVGLLVWGLFLLAWFVIDVFGIWLIYLLVVHLFAGCLLGFSLRIWVLVVADLFVDLLLLLGCVVYDEFVSLWFVLGLFCMLLFGCFTIWLTLWF